MSVKRYEWVACDEHSCHCDVVESTEGDMVDYEDYAALEARCAALAAENAGLKESRKNLAEFIHEELDAGYPLNMDVETPDTDAFLAEVRASAVDAAIEELNQLAERSEKEAPIAAEHHRSAALYMKLFAAQLRKGVQS